MDRDAQRRPVVPELERHGASSDDDAKTPDEPHAADPFLAEPPTPRPAAEVRRSPAARAREDVVDYLAIRSALIWPAMLENAAVRSAPVWASRYLLPCGAVVAGEAQPCSSALVGASVTSSGTV